MIISWFNIQKNSQMEILKIFVCCIYIFDLEKNSKSAVLLSLYLFISLSLYLFISLSLYLFISLSLY
ncbi:hypothetical protein R7W79_03735, partial [Mesomycoplasma ovipneumoniae]|uniref:hypothetical protein n=1 Tax=Mesomycoplasma ovipneumoniae TaxID=29562 RepID=UPI0029654465